MATTTKKLIVHSGTTNSGATLTAYFQFKEVTNDNTFQTTLSDFNFYVSYKSTNGGHTIGPWSSGTNSILNFKGTEHKFNATIPKTLGEGTHLLAKINIGPFVDNQANNGYFNYEIGVKWTANSSWGNVNNPSRTQSFSSYIEPAPKIISAPTTFTTGSTVTIKFTRPSSFKNTTIQACIAVKDGGTWWAEPEYGGTGYQTIDNSATSYTFSAELTKKIETGFPSAATEREVRFYLKWEGVSDKPHTSATAKLGTYSYQIPDSAISVSPIGNIQQQFTGSANIYILNAENAKIKVTFDSSKITLPANGTISTYEILQGGKVVASSGNSTIQNIILTNSKIGFRIKDSRGIYTTLTEKQLNVINYTPLTMEVSLGGYMDGTIGSTSTEGEINQVETKELLVSVSGECFWGNFSENNHSAIELTTSYIDANKEEKTIKKIIVKENPTSQQEQNSVNTGEDDEQLPEIEEEGVYISGAEYIISENEKGFYNFTFVLNNLISTQENSIKCTAAMVYSNNTTNRVPSEIEALETISNSQVAKEEIPIYDYNDESFRFNVPVEFFGGSKLLWKCSQAVKGWYMNDKQQITIPNFQDMPNGIVLVFSQFDLGKGEGEGEAVDWNFQSFFVSKHTIEVLNGCMQCFLLATHNLTRLGTKGLKFTKTTDGKGITITGRADNGVDYEGNTGGLKSENRSFVLRYIYGT